MGTKRILVGLLLLGALIIFAVGTFYIEDWGLAMQEGYSTATAEMREMGFGAGMGLPNIKKNADELKIESAVGKGTKLQMTIFIN